MSFEWPIVTLREFVDLLAGFAFKSAGYSEAENSVRLLRGDNIGQRVIRWEDAKRWPSGDLANLVRYALRVGDVVLAMDRPWIPAGLKVARVTESDTPSYLVQRVSRLRTKSSGDDNFLYALLSSPAFSAYIQNSTTGTAVPHISAKQILDYEFNLPPENTRAEIGQIVAFLDNRITLLRETNTTLEAIAQALFKSWFVDFDPVHAKQQGRAPEGMDAQTAALFPDSFEESELGMVPKGWRVGAVSDLGSVICGKTPPTSNPENYGDDVPFITIPDMHGLIAVTKTARSLSKVGAESQAKKYLPAGSVCVSCIATPGLVVRVTKESQTNQQINSVVPLDKWGKAFPLFLLRRIGDAVRAEGSGGSVFHNLSKSGFEKIPLLLPEANLAKSFNDSVEPLVQKIICNQEQAEHLSNLRDTLLPRLISGQLRLPEAQALVEDAVDA